jgi:hypothetical protein
VRWTTPDGISVSLKVRMDGLRARTARGRGAAARGLLPRAARPDSRARMPMRATGARPGRRRWPTPSITARAAPAARTRGHAVGGGDRERCAWNVECGGTRAETIASSRLHHLVVGEAGASIGCHVRMVSLPDRRRLIYMKQRHRYHEDAVQRRSIHRRPDAPSHAFEKR